MKNIIRLLVVAFALLLSSASASAQVFYVHAGQTHTFGVNVLFSVDQVGAEDKIVWEVYDNFEGINMAATPGNCPPSKVYFPYGNTGASVHISFLVEGVYMIKVTAINNCPTNNMKFYMVQVLPPLPVATLILNPDEVCRGDEADLIIAFEGEAPWSFELMADDGVNPPVITTYNNVTNNLMVITVSPTRTTTYTVTTITDVNGTNPDPSNSVTLTVKPRPSGSQIYQYDP